MKIFPSDSNGKTWWFEFFILTFSRTPTFSTGRLLVWVVHFLGVCKCVFRVYVTHIDLCTLFLCVPHIDPCTLCVQVTFFFVSNKKKITIMISFKKTQQTLNFKSLGDLVPNYKFFFSEDDIRSFCKPLATKKHWFKSNLIITLFLRGYFFSSTVLLFFLYFLFVFFFILSKSKWK